MFEKIRFKIVVSIILLICLTFAPSVGHAWHFFKRADFTKVIFIGDSLTAGSQNGSLSIEGQSNNYAALIAQQAGFELTQPLVSDPGIPPKLVLRNINPLIIERSSLPMGFRISPFLQATNLAVPGHTVYDALNKRPNLVNPLLALTNVVLGFPGIFNSTQVNWSQVEWAEALAPTFAFVWIGNNDYLGFAMSGGTEEMTDPDDFNDDIQDLLDRLEDTGADLILANIPDVTAIPFFLSAVEVASLVGLDLSTLGIDIGDLVTIEGVEQILAGTSVFPLPDEVVLDNIEIDEVRQAVYEVNVIIAREAYRRNIPLVNINLLFKFIQIFGIPVNGKLLNTKFLGGLFSLDGVHPTNTGYAIIANHFIRTLNFRYRAQVPRIRIKEIAENDPLVIPELLPNTLDVKRVLFKAEIGDVIRQFRSVHDDYYQEED